MQLFLKQSYQTDGANWPCCVTTELTPEIESSIALAKKIISENDCIKSIALRDAFKIDQMDKMDDAGRIGATRITVFSHGWYWEVQSKYDSSTEAEYEATTQTNQPLTFDDIDNLYDVVRSPNGCDLKQLEYGCGTDSEEIIAADKERRLLTLLDADGDNAVYAIGHHRVNCIAHYMTEKPMPEELYNSRIELED